MKKLFFVLFSLIIFSSFVSAVLTTNNSVYYSFDNDNLSGSNPLDSSVNSVTGVNDGATINFSGILEESFDYDGTNDAVYADNIGFNESTTGTVSVWFATNYTDVEFLVSYYDRGDTTGVANRIRTMVGGNTNGAFPNESITFEIYDGASNVNFFYLLKGLNFYNDGDWHHLVFGSDGANYFVYVDGVDVMSEVSFGTGSDDGTWRDQLDNADDLLIGARRNNNAYDLVWNDVIDEVSTWDRALSESEILELYNSGAALNFYKTVVPVINDSVESTAVVKQVGTVLISGGSPTTIISSDFNVSVNNTDIYGAYSFNVLSNNNNEIFCELEIDGVVFGNVSRSNVNGVLGSVYLQSQFFSLDAGNHTQSLICSRSSGAGNILISNAVGIGHFMIDEFNNTVPHDEVNFTTSTSSSSFEFLGDINFTISNRTIGGNTDIQHFLVVEWSGNYQNNAGGSELLNTQVRIDDFNCSFYPRTVSSGGVGSVSGDCLIRNATSNQTYNVAFYGKGSSADFVVDIKVKEFLLSPEEIAGGTVFPVNTSFVGNSDVRLFNISGGNIHHGLSNVFEKVAFSISSNESTTAIFYVKIVNGSNFTTINFTRDITSDVGVLIGHDILENVPQDSYVSELWANCGSSSANCTISGGDGIGYLTDITTTVLNAFNVTVFDNFDNNSISNFTVVNGASFSTTTGSLLFFTTNLLENLTITSNNYFNVTILNHDTSNDLNVSLNQTLISWNCSEKVSGNDLNCTSPLESKIFNYNLAGNPYTQSLNVTGYFERLITFNVSALQNETLNASNFFSTNHSFTVTSGVENSTPSVCVYNISSLNYSFSESQSTSTANVSNIGLINGSYNLIIDCDSFAIASVNFTVENVTQTLNTVLLTTNSINFSFYDEDLPLTALNNTNITFQLFSFSGANNYSTSDGFLYIDSLTAGDYEIRYTSIGWDIRSYFFTVSSRSTQSINLYLSNSSETTSYIIRVADLGDSDISNSTVRLQRQYVEFNGQYVTIEEGRTDNDGETDFFIQESSGISYRFIVLIDNEIVKITDPQFIINIEGISLKRITIRVDVGTSIFSSYEDSVGLFTLLNNSGFVYDYEFVDSKNQIIGGCLKVRRQVLGSVISTILNEQCVSGTSGFLSVNISSFILNDTVVIIEGLINYTGGLQVIVDSDSVVTNAKGDNSSDSDDILLTAFFYLIINLAIILIPNVLAQIFLTFLGLYFLSFIGFHNLGTQTAILLMVINLVINWTRKNTRDGEPR